MVVVVVVVVDGEAGREYGIVSVVSGNVRGTARPGMGLSRAASGEGLCAGKMGRHGWRRESCYQEAGRRPTQTGRDGWGEEKMTRNGVRFCLSRSAP